MRSAPSHNSSKSQVRKKERSIPEQCFRMKGSIEDVYAAYEEMKKAS